MRGGSKSPCSRHESLHLSTRKREASHPVRRSAPKRAPCDCPGCEEGCDWRHPRPTPCRHAVQRRSSNHVQRTLLRSLHPPRQAVCRLGPGSKSRSMRWAPFRQRSRARRLGHRRRSSTRCHRAKSGHRLPCCGGRATPCTLSWDPNGTGPSCRPLRRTPRASRQGTRQRTESRRHRCSPPHRSYQGAAGRGLRLWNR